MPLKGDEKALQCEQLLRTKWKVDEQERLVQKKKKAKNKLEIRRGIQK